LIGAGSNLISYAISPNHDSSYLTNAAITGLLGPVRKVLKLSRIAAKAGNLIDKVASTTT
jgi:hypothetical protein